MGLGAKGMGMERGGDTYDAPCNMYKEKVGSSAFGRSSGPTYTSF